MQSTHYVTTITQLEAAHAQLASQSSIALDLEFDSHSYAYGVNLCLIQIATQEQCYLFDPIMLLDLSLIFRLLEDASICKVMHSPGEDLRLLHSLGCVPQNVFDTEVVAKLLNYERFSLSALLEVFLGVTINKKLQRSNWLKRPLSTEQLEYAALDVVYLEVLKEQLQAAAKSKGIWKCIEEEQAAWSTTDFKPIEKQNFLKSSDFDLSPYDQYVLNEVFQLRERLAKKENRPSFQIMDEPTLRSIAFGSEDLETILAGGNIFGPFRNPEFTNYLSRKLKEIHATAQQAEYSKAKPKRPRLSPERLKAIEQGKQDKELIFRPIQDWLQAHWGLHASRFILSNGTVNDLVRNTTVLSAIPRQYKREQILQAAKECGVSVVAYWQ